MIFGHNAQQRHRPRHHNHYHWLHFILASTTCVRGKTSGSDQQHEFPHLTEAMESKMCQNAAIPTGMVLFYLYIIYNGFTYKMVIFSFQVSFILVFY